MGDVFGDAVALFEGHDSRQNNEGEATGRALGEPESEANPGASSEFAAAFGENAEDLAADGRLNQELDDPIEATYLLLKVGATSDMTSTQKKIKPMAVQWRDYCEAEGIEDEARHLHLLDENSNLNMQPCRKFLQHLDRLPGATKNLIDNGCQFLQTFYTTHCSMREIGALRGAVVGDSVIKAIRQKHMKAKAEKDIVEGVDIQAELDLRISPNQQMQLMYNVFNPEPGTEAAKLDELTRLQFGASYRRGNATGERGDEMRALTSNMCFLRNVAVIGPGGGTSTDMSVTNKGKSNTVGRKNYTAMAAHVNPLFDAVGMEGLCTLYRHSFLNEPFPNHLNWQDYGKRPLYREVRNHLCPMDKNTMYKSWCAMFDTARFYSDKVVHQPRRQMQQEMDDGGIEDSKAARMVRYAGSDRKGNKDRKQSYVTNPPADCIVQRGGGDPSNTKLHNPAWASVSTPALDDCLAIVAPYIAVEMQKVAAATLAATSHKEMKEQRLYMAKGSIESYDRRARRALLLAAARPYDSSSIRLNTSSPTIYDLYKDTFSLFKHHRVFKSVAFRQLVQDVHVAQEQEDSGVIDLSPVARNEIHVVVDSKVLPAIRGVQSEIRNVGANANTRLLHLERGAVVTGEVVQQLQNDLEATKLAVSDIKAMLMPMFYQALGRDYPLPTQAARLPRAPQPRPQIRASIQGSFADAFPVPGAALARARANNQVESNDDSLTAKGLPRKRKRAIPRIELLQEGMQLMSSNNITLQDYWEEFCHGRNGLPSLKSLEEQGKEWRRDPEPEDGSKRRGSFKTYWSYRAAIYNLITHYMEADGDPEEVALARANEIFLSVPPRSSKNQHRNLKVVAKLMRDKLKDLGGYKRRRWK